MEMWIRLDDIDSVRQLVGILDRYGCSARLTEGNTMVDARSLMQIFVLNLTGELLLTVDSENIRLWKELEKFRRRETLIEVICSGGRKNDSQRHN